MALVLEEEVKLLVSARATVLASVVSVLGLTEAKNAHRWTCSARNNPKRCRLWGNRYHRDQRREGRSNLRQQLYCPSVRCCGRMRGRKCPCWWCRRWRFRVVDGGAPVVLDGTGKKWAQLLVPVLLAVEILGQEWKVPA